MSNFTYEAKDSKTIYETYEWDNVWLEHADDKETKRVLYIGDSISCMTRRKATAKTGDTVYFDGFGTSKGLDNPYFKDAIKLFTKQQPGRNAIIINNGLHGWHLEDETEYKAYYEEMVKFLLEEFKNIPLFILLTTRVRDEERGKRVVVRNDAAKRVADKYGLTVIDLYAVSKSMPEFLSPDGIHPETEGYEALATEIVKRMGEELPNLIE